MPPKRTDFILALERDKSIGEEDLASGPILTSGASGSSRTAMLEQETEEIHRDRQRVEENGVGRGLERHRSGDFGVRRQRERTCGYGARVHAVRRTLRTSSGTVNVHAKQTATDRRSTVDGPSADSLTEAKSITSKVLGNSAKTLARADRERQLSRSPSSVRRRITSFSANPPAPASLIPKICFDRQPQTGESVRINYSDSKALSVSSESALRRRTANDEEARPWEETAGTLSYSSQTWIPRRV